MPTNSNRYRAFMMTATTDYETIESLEKKALRLWKNGIEYAIVKHDKDKGSDHYHLSIQLKHGMTITAVSKKLDIPANFIEKWDKRTYNMWAYMLHHTKDASDTKVDYTEYLENDDKFRTNIDNYLAKTTAPAVRGGSSNPELEKTINNVLIGEITRRDLLKPEKIQFYHQHMRKIDNAIKLRTESLKYNPPSCTTHYIWGQSGTGKTSKAVADAKLLYGENYTVASSSNDLLQDYTGEKCLIIDDYRPQNHDFVELLALLDPHHRQRTHTSRYYNKPLATEMIIITSIYSLEDTLRYYKDMNPKEEMKQLRRRISQTTQLVHDKAKTQLYDENTDEYSPISE